jgi:hypothetical protein
MIGHQIRIEPGKIEPWEIFLQKAKARQKIKSDSPRQSRPWRITAQEFLQLWMFLIKVRSKPPDTVLPGAKGSESSAVQVLGAGFASKNNFGSLVLQPITVLDIFPSGGPERLVKFTHALKQRSG